MKKEQGRNKKVWLACVKSGACAHVCCSSASPITVCPDERPYTDVLVSNNQRLWCCAVGVAVAIIAVVLALLLLVVMHGVTETIHHKGGPW